MSFLGAKTVANNLGTLLFKKRGQGLGANDASESGHKVRCKSLDGVPPKP